MQLNALIGKKVYQKQGFLQDGTRVPLTGVAVSGNFVSQIKSQDKEGYSALQIAFGKKNKANKTLLGHLKKAGIENKARFFREIKVDDVEGAALGSELNISEVFAPGDTIDVTGVSKGKGWAGGVKRWGFRGGPRTHGQSDRERAPGSIGQTTTPGRVYKGKKMAGRMGSDKVTVKNLEIIEITDDGVLMIKGLVPGALNSILTVRKVGENKKFVPLYKEVEEVVEEKIEAQPDALEEKVEEPVKEEAKTEEDVNADGGESRQSASADVQENAQDSSSDSASLNDSLAPTSEKNKIEAQPAVDSAESGQTPIAKVDNEEVKKEEVKE